MSVTVGDGAPAAWEVVDRRLSSDDAVEPYLEFADLLEQCGVDPDADRPKTWLATVRERLRADLASFRGGRVLAAISRRCRHRVIVTLLRAFGVDVSSGSA